MSTGEPVVYYEASQPRAGTGRGSKQQQQHRRERQHEEDTISQNSYSQLDTREREREPIRIGEWPTSVPHISSDLPIPPSSRSLATTAKSKKWTWLGRTGSTSQIEGRQKSIGLSEYQFGELMEVANQVNGHLCCMKWWTIIQCVFVAVVAVGFFVIGQRVIVQVQEETLPYLADFLASATIVLRDPLNQVLGNQTASDLQNTFQTFGNLNTTLWIHHVLESMTIFLTHAGRILNAGMLTIGFGPPG